MKTFWSKKAVVALVVSNVAMGAYIIKEKPWKKHRGHVSREALAADSVDRHGIVEPVYFKNSDDLQGCYESFLLREPKKDEGSVLVNVKITGGGAIDDLKLVQNDFDEPKFTQCIVEKIKATRLPASQNNQPVMIAHRFNFKRKTVNHIDYDQQ
jgi:hypothetical protein